MPFVGHIIDKGTAEAVMPAKLATVHFIDK